MRMETVLATTQTDAMTILLLGATLTGMVIVELRMRSLATRMSGWIPMETVSVTMETFSLQIRPIGTTLMGTE